MDEECCEECGIELLEEQYEGGLCPWCLGEEQ